MRSEGASRQEEWLWASRNAGAKDMDCLCHDVGNHMPAQTWEVNVYVWE